MEAGMEKHQYEQAIIIGRTQLAEKCAEMTARFDPSMKTLYFNIRGERAPKAIAELDNLEYLCLEKAQIMDYLRSSSRTYAPQKTLVFSIMNSYLFPRDVVVDPALEIINLHHALLPNHPGRNAEIWAIFEGDNVAGITWHMVTSEVDAGEIILQQQVKITEHMTALTLFRKLNYISVESFPKILKMVMSGGKIKTYPQPSGGHYRLRYAKERPADGILSLEWDIDKMYRFVRAMDYGALKVMGDPAVVIGEKMYTWKKYKVDNEVELFSENVEVLPNEICIRKGGKEIHLTGIREIC